jgi:hypothetical protein
MYTRGDASLADTCAMHSNSFLEVSSENVFKHFLVRSSQGNSQGNFLDL